MSGLRVDDSCKALSTCIAIGSPHQFWLPLGLPGKAGGTDVSLSVVHGIMSGLKTPDQQ